MDDNNSNSSDRGGNMSSRSNMWQHGRSSNRLINNIVRDVRLRQ
jgi:hypothetical protein